MKVLIVSPFAEPEKGANTLRISSLCSYFLSQNLKCEILAPKRSNVGKAKNVVRYSSIFHLFSKVFFSDAKKVIFTSPPLTHGFISGLGAKLSGKDFYLDIRDPWPLSYVQMGIYKKGWKLSFYTWLELKTYSLAKKIFCVTDGIISHISSKGFSSKTILAPNGASLESFSFPLKKPGKKKIYVYSGNIENIGLENLLYFFPSDSELWILSPVSSSHPLIKLAKKQLGSCFFFHNISNMPFSKVSSLIAKGDIGISIVPENMSYRIVVKTYDYCACGLFCLAQGPSKGSLKNLFQKYSIGKYFSDWKLFSRFSVPSSHLSISARKKRIYLSKKNFLRRETNKIIYSHITSD